jgi:hypothetical protein
VDKISLIRQEVASCSGSVLDLIHMSESEKLRSIALEWHAELCKIQGEIEILCLLHEGLGVDLDSNEVWKTHS